MAKDTFYFSHDYNARNDEKIKFLIRKHGMLGYGVFWSIVEELYNNANALRTHYDSIAYDLRTDEILIKSIVEDFDLFVIDGDFFGSTSIERRLEDRNKKSVKARESAIKRWDKCERNANALNNNANVSKSDAIKERKGKENKEKEIIEPKIFKYYEILGMYDLSTYEAQSDVIKEKYSKSVFESYLKFVKKFKKRMTIVKFHEFPLIDEYFEDVYSKFKWEQIETGITTMFGNGVTDKTHLLSRLVTCIGWQKNNTTSQIVKTDPNAQNEMGLFVNIKPHLKKEGQSFTTKPDEK